MTSLNSAQGLHERGICVKLPDCPLCVEEQRAKLCTATLSSVFDDPCNPPIPVPALTQTLRDRGEQYGDFEDMSEIAQMLKNALRDGGSWERMRPEQRESLDMIATKIARIVCGNPDNQDSWYDIQGYAKLSGDRLSPTSTATP